MPTMPPLRLNHLDSAQVASGKTLEVFIGTPPSRLLIFTGIAMPALESDGLLDHQEVTVDLDMRSNAPMPPFTATLGLASIYNTDSDLLFATDDVRVITGDNLELLLVCNLAAMGNRSVLNRFSYQATVLLQADNGSIAGNIRWAPHFMTFSAEMERDLFQIEAFTMRVGPGLPGNFGTMVRKVERVGHTIGQPAWQGSLMGISYEIDDLPLAEALIVSVVPKPGAFFIHSADTFNFEQISGPSVITLSAANLTEKPVDFEARKFTGRLS